MKFSYRNATNILMLAFFFLQGVFSFRIIGPAITIQRLFLVIIYLWTFFNFDRQQAFWRSVKKGRYNFVILVYLGVCFLTAILRSDFNTFVGVFIDCFLMYLLFLYFFDDELPEETLIYFLTKIVLAASIFGVFEYISKFNIFTFLSFADDVIPNSFRDGILRIRVSYGHPLAYGMFLVLFFPFCCYDCKQGSIYLFQRPVTLFLVMINILLTGSRSSIGIFGVELIILAIVTSKQMKGNLVLGGLTALTVGGFIILSNLDNPILQMLLRQIFYVIDELFDTQIAVNFGGNRSIGNSSIARKRLWKIFNYPGLDPLLGLGVSTKKYFIIDNWKVTSIDNFYVNQYIKLAYPGLIATIMMFVTYIYYCISGFLKYRSQLLLICLISGAAYFANLFVVDELATMKFFFFLMAFSRHIIQNRESEAYNGTLLV